MFASMAPPKGRVLVELLGIPDAASAQAAGACERHGGKSHEKLLHDVLLAGTPRAKIRSAVCLRWYTE